MNTDSPLNSAHQPSTKPAATHSTHELRAYINQLQQQLIDEPQYQFTAQDQAAIRSVIEYLDQGKIRVAEPRHPSSPHQAATHDPVAPHTSTEIRLQDDESWQVNRWVKQAIIYYFKIAPMETYGIGPYSYADKIPLKSNYDEFKVRVVPPATARYGAFLEHGVVLMPSYVNIGAYVGRNTMVDTWATVGSCAQIGADVHLAGGVGIGGVLEPPGATPVIIEDGAFIGSRAIIVEGVRIKAGAVIAANVTLTASSYIYDLRGETSITYRGIVPERAVVVPGVREKQFNSGKAWLNCAYIIGQRTASTDKKTSLNQVLREFSLSV